MSGLQQVTREAFGKINLGLDVLGKREEIGRASCRERV